MKTTIKDLARILNLNESTISRALNNNPKISEKTRNLVKEAALSNNYIVNTHARSLVTNKSNRIGILFPDDFFEFNKREFYSRLEKYLYKAFDNSDYELSLIRSNSLEKSILSGFIDGFIISNRKLKEEDYSLLIRSQIPHVFLAFKPTYTEEEVPLFKSDNFKNSYEVAKLLHKKGSQKLVTITSKDETLTDYLDRTNGFLKYIEEKDLRLNIDQVIKCDMTFEDGISLVENNLKLLREYDGIFCQQDKVALGIISVAEKHNLNIPGDVKIVGYDNSDLVPYFKPKLTTVEQDFEKIVLNAVECLISMLNDKKISVKDKLTKGKIILGKTV